MHRLTLHRKGLDKKDQMKPKVRRKETKIRGELNELETKQTMERIEETKSYFFKNRKINGQTFS